MEYMNLLELIKIFMSIVPITSMYYEFSEADFRLFL